MSSPPSSLHLDIILSNKRFRSWFQHALPPKHTTSAFLRSHRSTTIRLLRTAEDISSLCYLLLPHTQSEAISIICHDRQDPKAIQKGFGLFIREVSPNLAFLSFQVYQLRAVVRNMFLPRKCQIQQARSPLIGIHHKLDALVWISSMSNWN